MIDLGVSLFLERHGTTGVPQMRWEVEGLHTMISCRKVEIAPKVAERQLAHIIEVPVSLNSFGRKINAMVAFHREHGIPIRHGQGWSKEAQFYMRYCFGSPETADDFKEQFGGERLPINGPR
jgi:hypothetical protein